MFDIRTEIIIITILAGIALSLSGVFVVLKNDYPTNDITARSSVLGFAAVSMLMPAASLPIYIVVATFAGFFGFYLVLKLTSVSGIEKRYFDIAVPSVLLAFALIAIMGSDSNTIDIGTVFFGELALVPFDRIVVEKLDYGSMLFYVLIAVIIFNVISMLRSYKSLTTLCIDVDYGNSVKLNMSKANMIIAITSALSMAVAFYVGGVLMMLVFVLAPTVIAYYYAPRPSALVLSSLVISVTACIVGFTIAYTYAIPIVATIVCSMGLFLFIAAMTAPEKGLIHLYLINKSNRKNLCENILVVYMLQNTAANNIADISEYLKWKPSFVQATINALAIKGLVLVDDSLLTLTPKGEQLANKSLSHK